MPKLSIVVIVYKMARQATNTIYSLSARHQWNVSEKDYEIIVVENESSDMLDPVVIKNMGNNIIYLSRREHGVSPAPAINAAFNLVNSSYVGLLIDGARMVTPRVIEYAMLARKISEHSLTAVPSFNLGQKPHHQHIDAGHDEMAEIRLLETLNWKNNGYRLYDACNVSAANDMGIFHPFMENNCYFSSLENFRDIGFADESFQFPGGGSLNLHMFRAIGMLPRCDRYIIMPGEGTFHQFHGGVSTTQTPERKNLLTMFSQELAEKWQGKFSSLKREPLLLGTITSHSQHFLKFSLPFGEKRFRKLQKSKTPFFIDDTSRKQYVHQGDHSWQQ